MNNHMNHLTKQLVSNLTRVLRPYLRSVDNLVQRDRTIDAFARALEFAETPQDFTVGALVAQPPSHNLDWMELFEADWEDDGGSVDVRNCLYLIRFCLAGDIPDKSTVLLLVPPAPRSMLCCNCPDARWALQRAAVRAFNAAWPKRLLHPEIIGDHARDVGHDAIQAVLGTWNGHHTRAAQGVFTNQERLARATTERLRARDEDYTSVFRMQPPNRTWMRRPDPESRITNSL